VAPVLAFALRASQEAQARAEAEAARMHVTQALDELPDGFVALDRDWRVTYLNVAAATLWHLSRASALGRTFWELVRVPADAPLRTGSARAMLEGVAYEGELHMGDAWLGVRAVPSRMGVSLYIRDVTGRRTADAERERLLGEADRARAAAEQANQAKTDFLATMSHELRTPLNAILGYVALIADGISGPVTDGQMKHLGRVRASASHLLALIEEVLSFARLEAGSESARSEPADVVALGREAAQLVEPVIEAHGLRFAVEAPEGALSIRTDARKVRQILLNLLANAARFTPAGGEVVLSISVGPAGARLTVRDSGIGIEPEHQQQIFQPFWQVEQKLTRRAGGTGLGLSVSRRLARLLGGDVTVESAPGRGSAFTLTLPLEPWSPGAAGAGADG
jgi:signal transduction histidine kinase